MLPRQGTYKPSLIPEKNLRMSGMPLKDVLKRKTTRESHVVPQTVTNIFKKGSSKFPASPVYCSYPDFKSILLNDRKIDFSKKEISKKVNAGKEKMAN